MDLSTRVASSREVNLRDPGTHKDLGLVFTIRSPESHEVRKVDRQWKNYAYNMRVKKNRSPSVDEAEDFIERRILAHVEAWRWEDEELNFEGEQPAYSPEALKGIMKKLAWVKDFLSDEIGTTESFFEDSLTSF